MKRAAIIFIVSLLVFGGAFALYVYHQPPTAVATGPEVHPPAPPMPTGPGRPAPYDTGGVGGLQQYSKETGRISSDMRWQSFTRHKDGTTSLVKPSMSFYIGDGRRLTIVGETGQLDNFNPPTMTTATTGKQPVGTPDRGTLHHVHIYLYPTWDPKAQPNIILTTDNLEFDNATFRIATAAYTDEHGNAIAADQVPVHVTGDYLFDGRGLTVQWNDRDNRLELLEVAHGEQLTILHPNSAFGSSGPQKSHPTGSPHASASPLAFPSAFAQMLASADASAPGLILPSTRPVKPAKPPQPPYLARFFDNVVITQGLETKITADTMDVGFVLKQSTGSATTRPATQPAIAPTNAPNVPTTQAQGASTLGVTPATPEPMASQTQPSPIAPTEEPVVIHWTGPLRITPAPTPLDLAPGTSMVTLWGQPVVARHTDVAQLQTTQAKAASIVYYTADGSVSLRPSPAVPKVLLTRVDDSVADAPVMRVTAENLDYIGRNQEAIFSGPGEAHLPGGGGGNEEKPMDASWQQSARIFFVPTGHGQSAVSKAVLIGDVNVSHPQLSLQSQALELRFAPPANSANRAGSDKQTPQSGNGALRQVIATDTVNCRLTDAAGKKQTIDCQRLDVRMARDASENEYPRQIFADGNVHAFDADQELEAGHVELSLMPTTAKPHANAGAAGERGQAVALRSMYANDHVKLHGKAGQLATCDELQVDGNQGQVGRVELIGHDGLATVTDHQNVLSGPTIVMDSVTQQDSVIGPGTLHMVRQGTASAATTAPAKPASPIDVIWTDRAIVDGPANHVDAFGKVLITQKAEDGAISTARSPHLHIDLEDKPQAQGAGTPGVPGAATQPALVAGPATDVFKGKQAKAVTLDQGADVRSTLTDATTGALLREMVLKAPTVIYTLGQTPGQETLLVPTAGQMLIRDYRTADAGGGASAGTGGAQPAADDQRTAKGLTAFGWKKSLTYTAVDHQAVMLGDVHVRHLDNDQAEPADLFADRVTAHFQPASTKPRDSQATPTDAPLSSPMQLKDLHAEGNLIVTHGTSKITAVSMDDDPTTHLLTFHGTPANPVVESSTTGAGAMQALLATWNTDTWSVDLKDVMVRGKTK